MKKFIDQQTARKQMSADSGRELWISLRNTVEMGVAHGALELYIRTDSISGAASPATLMVSILPMRNALHASPEEFAQALQKQESSGTEISIANLPAGRTVRVSTTTTLDYYVQMTGESGYVLLSFTVPLSGVQSSMGDLCEAIAESLRWVYNELP
ncbi:hypothetical protein [Streptomyces sp. NPDC055794]